MTVPQKSSNETTGDEMTGDIQDRIQIHYINMTLMQHSTTRVIGSVQKQVKDTFNNMTLMPEPFSASKTIYTGCRNSPIFELNPVTLEMRVIPAVRVRVAGARDYLAAASFPNPAYEHNLVPCLRGPWAQSNLLPCFLPHQLLRGPWTEDKLDMLQILRLRCLGVAPHYQSSGSEGLMDALKEHNMRAMDLLIPEMGLQACPPISAGATRMAPIPNACVYLDVSVNRYHLNYLGCH